jgi:nitric oxide dioxygenase
VWTSLPCVPDIKRWKLTDQIFIDTERGIYNDGVAHGGWEGFRPFKIAKKDDATEEISHFYLEPINPADRVPEFTPGQYISVMTDIPSLGYKQARQCVLFTENRYGRH